MEIMNIKDDELSMTNNLLNHKEDIHKAISTFNDCKANKTVDFIRKMKIKIYLFLTRKTLSTTSLIIVTLPKSATNNGVLSDVSNCKSYPL